MRINKLFNNVGQIEIDEYLPKITSQSTSPYNRLEIGQSFHISCDSTDEKLYKTISANTKAATARSRVPSGATKQKTIRTYERDAQGKILIVDGKRVVSGVADAEVQVTKKGKVFKCWIATADDPRGPGVRVGRIS